ncbi:MAG: HTH domain-containing protein [Anaplasmataceae bacterium]|nr:HTH domain-containing protein [Anaplasmataceae bacterium]
MFLDHSINNIISMEIDVYKAKLLNHIRLQQEKGKQALKKRIKISVLGKHYTVGFFKPYIEELKKEEAIIDDGHSIFLTNLGKKILDDNFILTKRKIEKSRITAGILKLTDLDKSLFLNIKEKIKNNHDIVASDIADELDVSRQLISKRINKLKKLGYITFLPRQYNTIKILKEME